MGGKRAWYASVCMQVLQPLVQASMCKGTGGLPSSCIIKVPSVLAMNLWNQCRSLWNLGERKMGPGGGGRAVEKHSLHVV